MKFDPDFPAPGTKLKYKGVHMLWFTDIIKNAKDNLIVGNEYTLKTIDVASSWCCISLEETGDIKYALSFFYPHMRNPYNKYYYEFDELCIVRNGYELQKVMNFLIVWDINANAFHFDTGSEMQRSIMVPKGDLTKNELKEARDATSGILWALRMPELQGVIKSQCKVLKF